MKKKWLVGIIAWVIMMLMPVGAGAQTNGNTVLNEPAGLSGEVGLIDWSWLLPLLAVPILLLVWQLAREDNTNWDSSRAFMVGVRGGRAEGKSERETKPRGRKKRKQSKK